MKRIILPSTKTFNRQIRTARFCRRPSRPPSLIQLQAFFGQQQANQLNQRLKGSLHSLSCLLGPHSRYAHNGQACCWVFFSFSPQSFFFLLSNRNSQRPPPSTIGNKTSVGMKTQTLVEELVVLVLTIVVLPMQRHLLPRRQHLTTIINIINSSKALTNRTGPPPSKHLVRYLNHTSSDPLRLRLSFQSHLRMAHLHASSPQVLTVSRGNSNNSRSMTLAWRNPRSQTFLPTRTAPHSPPPMISAAVRLTCLPSWRSPPPPSRPRPASCLAEPNAKSAASGMSRPPRWSSQQYELQLQRLSLPCRVRWQRRRRHRWCLYHRPRPHHQTRVKRAGTFSKASVLVEIVVSFYMPCSRPPRCCPSSLLDALHRLPSRTTPRLRPPQSATLARTIVTP